MNNPEIFSNFVNNAIKDIREGFQADADRESLPNFPPLPIRLEKMEDARPFIQHWKSINARKQYISFISNVGSILLSLINELGKRLNKSESILSLVGKSCVCRMYSSTHALTVIQNQTRRMLLESR